MMNFLASTGLALTLCGSVAWAQAVTTETKTAPAHLEAAEVVRTFYLGSVTQVNDANEILTGLRNILDPRIQLILMPTENAITIRANPAQVALAERLIKEWDRARKSFRLTYTMTETDHGKKIGVQHFTMILASGGRTVMKEGSRVPVAVGSVEKGGGGSTTQFTYLDVGLNVDATVDSYTDGVRLRTKIEQSAIAEEHSQGSTDPVIRQTTLEGTSILTEGKPHVLGSLDVPGSTRHLDVEVLLEAIP